MRVNTKIAFWVSFLSTLLGPALFSKCHLLYFSPYLILSCYKFSLYGTLYRSLGCGVLVDLLSSTPYFGLSSVNYCLVSFVFHGRTRNFFEDKLSTLPLMTSLFSLLSTLFFVILAPCFGQKITLCWKWGFTDLMAMSLFDALFALTLFSLPVQGIYTMRKIFRKVR